MHVGADLLTACYATTVVPPPSGMEKSARGAVRAGMKISCVLPGLRFRRWLSIKLWMSLRQAEMQTKRPVCQMEEGRERVGQQ